jgi:hypothetical protein
VISLCSYLRRLAREARVWRPAFGICQPCQDATGRIGADFGLVKSSTCLCHAFDVTFPLDVYEIATDDSSLYQ